MATRKYEQRLRAVAAEETRRRILDAVYERLREAPSEPVSVDRIARMAGVSRSTVYLIFGSRAGLFEALFRDLMERGGFERIMQAVAQEDARESMRAAIRAAVDMYAANREVLRVLSAIALFETEAVGEVMRRLEQGRAGGMALHARRMAEQGLLRPDVSVEEAADLLWLLTSFESFDVLHTGRSLTVERTADSLVATAERSLCR